MGELLLWVHAAQIQPQAIFFSNRHSAECHCAAWGHDMCIFVCCPLNRVSANQRDTRIALIDQQQSPEASTTECWLANGWNCNSGFGGGGWCTIPLRCSEWMHYGLRARRSMSRSVCFFYQQAFNHRQQLVGRRCCCPGRSFVNGFAASVRPLVYEEQQQRSDGLASVVRHRAVDYSDHRRKIHRIRHYAIFKLN